MLKNILKPLAEPGVKGAEKKTSMWLIGGIILAILFLALSSFWDQKPKNQAVSQQDVFYDETYVKDLEQRLVSILRHMEGVGEVKVFITMESTGEKVLATDTRLESEILEDETEHETREQREETVVFGRESNGQNPYIVEERTPQPAGVLVIAKGARAEHVRSEIYEAVKALFGLSPHRIKVSY